MTEPIAAGKTGGVLSSPFLPDDFEVSATLVPAKEDKYSM